MKLNGNKYRYTLSTYATKNQKVKRSSMKASKDVFASQTQQRIKKSNEAQRKQTKAHSLHRRRKEPRNQTKLKENKQRLTRFTDAARIKKSSSKRERERERGIQIFECPKRARRWRNGPSRVCSGRHSDRT